MVFAISRVSQRGRCPCMSLRAGHGKLLGVVVVGGRRWRKPMAAGAGRGAQGMRSGVWSEARGCERRGARIGFSAGGA